MAFIGSIILWIFISKARKVYNRRMSKQILVVGVYKELLPMACLRQSQQEVLAKSQIIGKR